MCIIAEPNLGVFENAKSALESRVCLGESVIHHLLWRKGRYIAD